MAEIKRTSVAVFGTGTVDDDTATALLNDWLPKALGGVFVPNRIPRRIKTLNAVINWLESPDVLGENGTVGSEDVIAELLNAQEQESDDVAVVYIRPEGEIPEDELTVLKDALDNGIVVKDLAAALNDLDMDEVFPPDEPTEEEAVEEPPAETPAATVPDSPYSNEAFLASFAGFVTQIVYSILRSEGLLDKAGVKEVAAKATTAAKAKASGDKPPFDPPFKEAPGDAGTSVGSEERIKYWHDRKTGRYRKAVARPRGSGEDIEVAAMLTLEEIDDLVQRGLIDENKPEGGKPAAGRRSARSSG